MNNYVQDNYGSVQQQLQGALLPNAVNTHTGNLIHPLPGAFVGGRTRGKHRRRRTRGGDMGAVIAPATLLAMQQLYGRKKSNKKSKFRYKRSRRYRTR